MTYSLVSRTNTILIKPCIQCKPSTRPSRLHNSALLYSRSCFGHRWQRFSRSLLHVHATDHPLGMQSEISRDDALRLLTDALVVSFCACKTQSLFALRCLIKTVIEMYKEACTINELQILLTVKPFESGATILTDEEQNILLSWSAIIMLTLHQVQLLATGDLPLDQRLSTKAAGMTQFVDQVLALVRSGTDLESLLETQKQANQETQITPSARLMQQNSIIITLTASIVQESTPTQDQISNSNIFVNSFIRAPAESHGLSVKCLVCFIGGSLGSVFCIDRFISSVTQCYASTLTAKKLVEGISEEVYEEAWNLIPALHTSTGLNEASLTRQLFGRWVSIVFITLAESGLEHALSSTSSGWAWAFDIQEDTDMFEMTNLSNFVSNALRRVKSEDNQQPLDLSDRLKNVPDMLQYLPQYKEEAEKKKVEKYGSSFTAIEDEDLGKTSPTAFAFWQMILLVHLTYRKLLVYQEEHS